MIGQQALYIVCYLNGVIDVRIWLATVHQYPCSFSEKKAFVFPALDLNLPRRFDHPPNEGKRRTGGGLEQGHYSLYASTSCISGHTNSIKVDTFLLCFRHCDDCQYSQVLPEIERGTFGCVWVGCTNRSSFYLRGHPQAPVGDVLTVRCLQSWRWWAEGKKAKKCKFFCSFEKRTDCGIQSVKNQFISCLAFSK